MTSHGLLQYMPYTAVNTQYKIQWVCMSTV